PQSTAAGRAGAVGHAAVTHHAPIDAREVLAGRESFTGLCTKMPVRHRSSPTHTPGGPIHPWKLAFLCKAASRLSPSPTQCRGALIRPLAPPDQHKGRQARRRIVLTTSGSLGDLYP